MPSLDQAMKPIDPTCRNRLGGKRSTTELPIARISHSSIYGLQSRGSNPLVMPRPDGFAEIAYGRQHWTVQLDLTPLHFGGARRWLLCPECGGRRQGLYIDSHRLACRTCLKLRYDTQHENPRQRAMRAASKTRSVLGWRAGVLNPSGSKPKGMHWRTYRRLTHRLDVQTSAALARVMAWVDLMEQRLTR
jgi:hypothetical protein